MANEIFVTSPHTNGSPLDQKQLTSPVLSGTRLAMRVIAREALARMGSLRLPTTQDLQGSLGVGAGTVQNAYSVLEEVGALKTRSHGHKGRFVETADLAALWGFADLAQVRIFATPPGAIETHALLQALTESLESRGLVPQVTYMRGGEDRLRRVEHAETSFAAASAGTVETFVRERPGALATHALASGSYYAPGSVVVLKRQDMGATRGVVGVDHDSHDHRIITEAQFGPLSSFPTRQIPFPEVPAAILRGDVDMGVWHRMALVITPELAGLDVSPLSPNAEKAIIPLSPAVLAYRLDNPFLAAVFQTESWQAVGARQFELMEHPADADGIWAP